MAWAVASIADVLLVIFVAGFGAAVLSPVASAMQRRLGWSRGLCAAALVLAGVLVIGAVVLVLAQAISGAVRDLGDHLPQLVDKARHSDLGNVINGGSGSPSSRCSGWSTGRARGTGSGACCIGTRASAT
jgi:predicted PurR-regulated permease PerM